MPNEGVLSVTVWPTYVGVSNGDPGPGPRPLHEPFEDINYCRGQISWRVNPADGSIIGSAQIFVPKGIWDHFVFCYGPIQDMMAGTTPLEHPIIFDRPGIVDLDPIQNQDYLPRLPA